MSTGPEVAAMFDDLVGDLVYSMVVVTARRGDERSGCLVGFATQVSIDPSRFLVCLSLSNHTYGVALDSPHVAVHVVPADRMDIAELFGGETGEDVDKFAHCDWSDGPDGVPLLAACPRWFVGRVLERVPFGDHVGFVLEPVAVGLGERGAPLTSPRALVIEPGQDP